MSSCRQSFELSRFSQAHYGFGVFSHPPSEGEKCLQWSSYDRKSRLENGKYLEWDANGDNNGHLRMEGEQMVIGEMDGPGCIWRIWSGTPEQGHVKIYLDGNSIPAVDLPFVEYFNRTQAPFNTLNSTTLLPWVELLRSDSVSKILQNRSGSGLGTLLSLHLQYVCQRCRGPHFYPKSGCR